MCLGFVIEGQGQGQTQGLVIEVQISRIKVCGPGIEVQISRIKV